MQQKVTRAGITYQRQNQTDHIYWTNKELPPNKPLLLGYGSSLLLLIPIAIFLTNRLIRDSQMLPNFIQFNTGAFLFSLFIIIAIWTAILAISHILLRLTWTEKVIIAQDELLVQYDGPLAYKDKRIPIDHIWRLSFEKYKFNRDRESRYSVNIIHHRRHMLAYWMRKEEAYQLFLILGQIIQARGWSEQIRIEDKNGD